MTTAEPTRLVARNLLRTYFALGKASPGAQVTAEAGFSLCTGNFDHPICNFAADLQLNPWVANRLAEIALERHHFHVYSTSGDLPASRDVRDEILIRAGFERVYSLNQLIWEPSPIDSEAQLTFAKSTSERRAAADFMAGQFFSRHSSSFRRRVSDSTAGAEGQDLYAWIANDEIIASVMVSEDDSLLGLFNLCVKPGNQNRGYGASVVAAIQRMANERGKPVGLQCEESLRPWYEHLGFTPCGFVDVYALPDERRIAIID